MTTTTIADTVGIGFGPGNIALAVAAEEHGVLDRFRFFEAAPGPQWQPGMLLSDSDIQHNPVRDLVSLRNPRSFYSFINYLHEHGRLLPFLNLPVEFPLRKDFAKYVTWVAEQVPTDVAYGMAAARVTTGADRPWRVEMRDGSSLEAQRVVVGVGRSRNIPAAFRGIESDRVYHSTSYLEHLPPHPATPPPRSVLIVGASQSAVELALDLNGRFPDCHVELVSRGLGPRLKDTSPFTEHAYFPEFTDYYYGLDNPSRRALDTRLRSSNYSAADKDVIDRLYVRMYEQVLDGEPRIILSQFRDVVAAETAGDQVRVTTKEVHSHGETLAEYDHVILATGFRDLGPGDGREVLPALLHDVADDLLFDGDGYVQVTRAYEVLRRDESRSGIYLNGLCESSHGLGDAGSFSLLSLRASQILGSIEDQSNEPVGAGLSDRAVD